MKTRKFIFSLLLLTVLSLCSISQNANIYLTDSVFSGLKMRSIGPAFMSGRIADIAIHPENNSVWLVAVGSGGVWKTNNAGTTWTPVFDDQKSYSTGCITIDNKNPNIIWVGTGENVGGRHVGFGDGIYKSIDGGINWKNVGLKKSEHISKIIVHPNNSNIVWVAAQGPLWSEGGERGVFKTTDGGKTWHRTLGDDKWQGATDILIDPRNPDKLYAATWERHRNIAVYIGGGPGSGIHSSDDGGTTWTKLTQGLPKSEMGKIGLAISPQKPDVIYAAIELDRRAGGVYRSTNRGASWTKMSATVSGATGPHYYQELYASPHHFDRLYLVDVRMQISEDGGKTFRRMNEKYKHSDNHAIAFRAEDPNYLLVGTDGGIYESFDLAANWRFINNLPVTQYYKVAVDDAEPFYTIYGGTQDNNTQGGPSRTDNFHGIRNSDWFITLFGDGHQPAIEPGNPDIMYSELQEGMIFRVDRTSGELVYIQPQAGENEEFERFNWDAPILVSPHSPTRLYYASQRVWRSEDRGNSWTAISGDLTKNQNRLELPIDGKTWSWDAGWDIYAMSTYNTITSLAESPVKEGVIYAGTDDGHIQVTIDGGESWTKTLVGDLPGVPSTAFVNDIKADLYDENTAYIALDNHKFGDYTPYLLKSTNKGKSWTSIIGNIPDRTLVWRIIQDHIKPELLFTATEFGIYFTINGGEEWIKIKGGVPTISFRDLAIQRRENDLIGASFGRGFFVLDDYSLLRNVSIEQLKEEATLFPIRKAWHYIQRPILDFDEKGAQGASYYTAPNPPFGAVFNYYLKENYKTRKEIRLEQEKKTKENIPFPGWEAVEAERREEKPLLIFTIKDTNGNVMRKIETPAKAGFNRAVWDLNTAAKQAINTSGKKSRGEFNLEPTGFLVAPGIYTVTLSKKINGVITNLSKPKEFAVESLREGALEKASSDITTDFFKDLENTYKKLSALNIVFEKSMKKADAMQTALKRADIAPGIIDKDLFSIKQKMYTLDEKLNGNKSKDAVGEKYPPTISNRLMVAVMGVMNSTYGPTETHINAFNIAKKELTSVEVEINTLVNTDLPALEQKLVDAGAPLIR